MKFDWTWRSLGRILENITYRKYKIRQIVTRFCILYLYFFRVLCPGLIIRIHRGCPPTSVGNSLLSFREVSYSKKLYATKTSRAWTSSATIAEFEQEQFSFFGFSVALRDEIAISLDGTPASTVFRIEIYTSFCFRRRIGNMSRKVLSLLVALVALTLSRADDPEKPSSRGAHHRQKRLFWITNDGRIALPPGTVMTITPTLALPFVRYPPYGFLSNMTISLPFTSTYNFPYLFLIARQ